MSDEMGGEQDPGVFIGQQPEREPESIPGGVKPKNEREPAHDAAPGFTGEPDTNGGTNQDKTEFDRHREAGAHAEA